MTSTISTLLGFKGCFLVVDNSKLFAGSTLQDIVTALPDPISLPKPCVDSFQIERDALLAIQQAIERDKTAAAALSAAIVARSQKITPQTSTTTSTTVEIPQQQQQQQPISQQTGGVVTTSSSEYEALVKRQQEELERFRVSSSTSIKSKRSSSSSSETTATTTVSASLSPPIPQPQPKQRTSERISYPSLAAVTTTTTTSNNIEQIIKKSPHPEIFVGNKKELLVGLIEMGFSSEASISAIEVFGSDDKVYAFASAFQSLREMKFNESLLKRPLVLFDCDVIKCADFLRKFSDLLEKGITSDEVNFALDRTNDDSNQACQVLQTFLTLKGMGFSSEKIRDAINRYGHKDAINHLCGSQH